MAAAGVPHGTPGTKSGVQADSSVAFTGRPLDARHRRGEAPDAADASALGTASELVLACYGRIPVDYLRLAGDRRVFDRLIAWKPDA